MQHWNQMKSEENKDRNSNELHDETKFGEKKKDENYIRK